MERTFLLHPKILQKAEQHKLPLHFHSHPQTDFRYLTGFPVLAMAFSRSAIALLMLPFWICLDENG